MDITSYLLGKNSSGGGGGGSDLDWSALGYAKRPQVIDDGYNYAKQIQNTWTPSSDLTSKFAQDYSLIYMPLVDTSETTNMYQMFYNCSTLQSIPLLNTSNVTSMGSMFHGCTALKELQQIDTSKVVLMNSMFNGCYSLTSVPILNTSSVKGTNAFSSMFNSCISLSDESLNNILEMCITATQYNGTKTLSRLGFNSTYYPASRIQSLSNYQDFLDAGWTIGY